jgi:hypothetical protein
VGAYVCGFFFDGAACGRFQPRSLPRRPSIESRRQSLSTSALILLPQQEAQAGCHKVACLVD